eukprot:3771370-Prymnesium_polylepis.2
MSGSGSVAGEASTAPVLTESAAAGAAGFEASGAGTGAGVGAGSGAGSVVACFLREKRDISRRLEDG